MASKRQQVRGEVKVEMGRGMSGTVGSSQMASIDKIMGMAAEIWQEVKTSDTPKDDEKASDHLLKTMRAKYKDFAVSYPIPFRWMIQSHEYVPGVFKKWITHHVKMMYKDRMEFLAAQGEYLVLLYRHRNPRVGASAIGRYRAAIKKSLKEDDDIFQKARKEADEEVERIKKKVDMDRRKRLLAYLQRAKASGKSD
jgi:hypothetical protein